MCMQTHRVRARMDSGLNFLEGHVPPIDGLTQRVADFLFEYLLLNKHRLNLVEVDRSSVLCAYMWSAPCSSCVFLLFSGCVHSYV